MARIEGNAYSIFVKEGAASATPGAPTEYTKVGQRTSFTLSGSANEIEIRDADGVSVRFSSNKNTGEIGVNYDPDGDAGVEILRDAYNDNPKSVIHVLVSTTGTGKEHFFFDAVVGSFNLTLNDNAAATATFSLGIQGAITDGTNP